MVGGIDKRRNARKYRIATDAWENLEDNTLSYDADVDIDNYFLHSTILLTSRIALLPLSLSAIAEEEGL